MNKFYLRKDVELVEVYRFYRESNKTDFVFLGYDFVDKGKKGEVSSILNEGTEYNDISSLKMVINAKGHSTPDVTGVESQSIWVCPTRGRLLDLDTYLGTDGLVSDSQILAAIYAKPELGFLIYRGEKTKNGIKEKLKIFFDKK